jgi:hypothetical protein
MRELVCGSIDGGLYEPAQLCIIGLSSEEEAHEARAVLSGDGCGGSVGAIARSDRAPLSQSR